jgi:CHAD domain-containing protein
VATAWEVPGLRPGTRFRVAAGRVILTRWREMMSYADGTRAGEDIEFLHDMRVSSRRLRSAMDAFAAAFPKRSFGRHLAQVKEITDTLGAARDLDVAVAGLEALLDEMEPDQRVGIEALAGEYRTRRTAESGVIASLLDRVESEGYAARFERWVAKHTGVDPRRLATGPPAR